MKNSKEGLNKETLKKMEELRDKIQKRRGLINSVISNYKSLFELSDQELRLKSINDSYQSEQNWCKSSLGNTVGGEIQQIMAFNKGNLGAINDPLVNGIIEIEKINYAVFTFGTTHEKMALSKILKRTMTAEEYYRLLSGRVLIGESKEDVKYFIKRPEYYNLLIEDYNRNHPSRPALNFPPKAGMAIEAPIEKTSEVEVVVEKSEPPKKRRWFSFNI